MWRPTRYRDEPIDICQVRKGVSRVSATLIIEHITALLYERCQVAPADLNRNRII